MGKKDTFIYFSTGFANHRFWVNPIGGTETNNFPGAEVLVLSHENSDIDPIMYGNNNRGAYTVGNKDADILFDEQYNFARSKGMKVIGINRGALYLAAIAGAKIIQDVNGHGKPGYPDYHNIISQSGSMYWIYSEHHQMMDLGGMPKDSYKILSVSAPRISTRYLNQYNIDYVFEGSTTKESFIEPEIVLFPKKDSLAIMPNIEKMPNFPVSVAYIREIIKEFISDKL